MRAYFRFLLITHTTHAAGGAQSIQLTTLPARRHWNLCSFPRRGKIFFQSQKRPARLWGPNFLFNVCRGLFTLGTKRPKRKADQWLSSANVKNITSLSIVLTWRCACKHRNSFPFTLHLQQFLKCLVVLVIYSNQQTLEDLLVPQIVTKLPAFYRIPKFITVLTVAFPVPQDG